MRSIPYEEGKKALCFLDMISIKNPTLCAKLNKSSHYNISCLNDLKFKNRFFKCEIGSTNLVLALLSKLSDRSFSELDEGYLSAESCLGEEEAEEILLFLKGADFLILDNNLKRHKDFENILFFASFLVQKFQLKLSFSDEKEEEFKINEKFLAFKELDNYDGLILFTLPLNDDFIHCSKQFLQIAKLQNKDKVYIKTQNMKLKAQVLLDENLSGTIAFCKEKIGDFDFIPIGLEKRT